MKKQLGTFVYAVLAGFCIGVGGNVYLALLPVSKPLGALLFAVGLFTICTFGLALFTGRACYLFDNPPSYLISLAVTWVGNLAGAWAMAMLPQLTRLGPSFREAAMSLCQTKLDDSLLSLFVLGALCNVLIYIAVEGYKNCPNQIGKYLSILFGVVVFILTGTEHSIADMYYFASAGILWTGEALLRIVIITLGNVCGGLILPLGRRLAGWLSEN